MAMALEIFVKNSDLDGIGMLQPLHEKKIKTRTPRWPQCCKKLEIV